MTLYWPGCSDQKLWSHSPDLPFSYNSHLIPSAKCIWNLTSFHHFYCCILACHLYPELLQRPFNKSPYFHFGPYDLFFTSSQWFFLNVDKISSLLPLNFPASPVTLRIKPNIQMMACKALCYLYPASGLTCLIASLTTLASFSELQHNGLLPFQEPTRETPALRYLGFFLPGMLFPQVFAWITPSLHSSLCSDITYVELSPNNVCKISTPVIPFLLNFSCINIVYHLLPAL